MATVHVVRNRPAARCATGSVGSTPDTDHRWLDLLAERLAKHGDPVAYVSNQAISGNRVLNDGFGVSAIGRFDRDVLETPGLGFVVVVEGGNDIGISFAPRGDNDEMAGFLNAFPGDPVTAEDLIAGYGQLIVRAHGRGVTGSEDLRRHNYALRRCGNLYAGGR